MSTGIGADLWMNGRSCGRWTKGWLIDHTILERMQEDGSMRHDGPYRICFVCSGNICRSPIAESVMRAYAVREGLDAIVVDSAGTGDWHIGERADLRTLQVLAAGGYDGRAHRARQFDARWFGGRELVIALDRGHARTLRALAPDGTARAKVRLLRSFDPALSGHSSGPDDEAPLLDVRDPYYEGEQAFVDVLRQVEAACQGLLDAVGTQLRTPTPG
jgi:protein-tyrosine phosphatase